MITLENALKQCRDRGDRYEINLVDGSQTRGCVKDVGKGVARVEDRGVTVLIALAHVTVIKRLLR